MISDFLEMLAGTVFSLITKLFSVLPAMPFTTDDITQYMEDNLVVQALAWFNWLFPVDVAAAIIGLWSTAMLAYVGLKLAIKYSGR